MKNINKFNFSHFQFFSNLYSIIFFIIFFIYIFLKHKKNKNSSPCQNYDYAPVLSTCFQLIIRFVERIIHVSFFFQVVVFTFLNHALPPFTRFEMISRKIIFESVANTRYIIMTLLPAAIRSTTPFSNVLAFIRLNISDF